MCIGETVTYILKTLLGLFAVSLLLAALYKTAYFIGGLYDPTDMTNRIEGGIFTLIVAPFLIRGLYCVGSDIWGLIRGEVF
jgi:hypothetical protein